MSEQGERGQEQSARVLFTSDSVEEAFAELRRRRSVAAWGEHYDLVEVRAAHPPIRSVHRWAVCRAGSPSVSAPTVHRGGNT